MAHGRSSTEIISIEKELVTVSTHTVMQWSVSKTQVSTSLDGETVVLNVSSGRYFSLSGVGGTLWEALREPRSEEALLSVVTAHYDVDAETASRDVRAFLGTLHKAGLAERA